MAEGYSQRPKSLDDPTNYEVRRSNDPELTSTALLQEAYDDLKLVIRESGLALDATYEQFWNDLATDVITIEGSHKESIFEIHSTTDVDDSSITLVFTTSRRAHT